MSQGPMVLFSFLERCSKMRFTVNRFLVITGNRLKRFREQIWSSFILSFWSNSTRQCDPGSRLPLSTGRLSWCSSPRLVLHSLIRRRQSNGNLIDSICRGSCVHINSVVVTNTTWGHLVDMFVCNTTIRLGSSFQWNRSIYPRWPSSDESGSYNVQPV